MAQLDIAQGLVDQMFAEGLSQQPTSPVTQGTLPQPTNPNEPTFQEQYFPQYDPGSILEDLGPVNGDESRRRYRFAGDGKIYNAKADKPLDKVLEGIWDHNSPGLWGSAKAQTLYGLPADMSSAIAYGLGGLGLDESSEEWRNYSNGLREEYQKKYGQFMVPGFDEALEQGKLWDFATQSVGFGVPYMGMALAGGGAGVAAAGAAGATSTGALSLGSFLGSTTITSPVLIAQFADRQVAEMREAGVEDPEKRIDWLKAAGLGTLAAGAQALPIESILFGGPLLKMVQSWGVKQGTPTSARLLASLADVAGTNALVGAGTSYLSRLNADMPLLDDEAKKEYLDSAIVGSLVGIPFGIYRGIKGPRDLGVKSEIEKPLDQIINENEASVEAPTTVNWKPGDLPEGVAGLLPPPRQSILHDPTFDYGIKNAEEAAAYLDSIKYKDKETGEIRSGLQDFISKPGGKGIGYSDKEIVDTARRVARINDQQNYLKKSGDGILYPTIDSLPQVHSNDPVILTKAAALADQFGYQDSFVKSLSDTLVDKLYNVNLKRELEKTTSQVHKDVFDQVIEKANKLVDKDVMKQVEEYGSLYQRPDAIKRNEMTVSERREAVSKNPREELARQILGAKRPKDKPAGRAPEDVELTPYTKPKDQVAFEERFINTPKQLEYKPIVDAINKGASSPEPRINEKVSNRLSFKDRTI
jgi:hypothetical protein